MKKKKKEEENKKKKKKKINGKHSDNNVKVLGSVLKKPVDLGYQQGERDCQV
jgi:hypothetical protein